ncbi:hypothetical protein [Pseudoduganella albidiflava]|uniref:Uncharacterized protein n=1 Tax=Pseudoduganella albidiflava TaxID=321983 RepID=A0A411WYH8_9BURK|nr:hypothetical protein [Pseudoduganella albidiflava]QBI01751.1 hypothetical protein EYF70_13490 [Pseudoduganella albidiflava]GGY39980.1 hypothetical protein GCM10007387_22660 [Pseudoduganella albidiflava]
MSYSIQAFVALQGTFNADPSNGLAVIRLDAGVEIIPIGSTARKLYGIPFLPLTDEGSEELPAAILKLHSTLGSQWPSAYIEAEFFGGSGAQAHVLISKNGAGAGVNISDNAINDALAWLGVRPRDGKDRFDTVGLGKHRETDGWLASYDQ